MIEIVFFFLLLKDPSPKDQRFYLSPDFWPGQGAPDYLPHLSLGCYDRVRRKLTKMAPASQKHARSGFFFFSVEGPSFGYL